MPAWLRPPSAGGGAVDTAALHAIRQRGQAQIGHSALLVSDNPGHESSRDVVTALVDEGLHRRGPAATS